MTYLDTIEFLYSLRLFGLKLGLDNTRALAAAAGNPEDRLRFIHIAGTNGKGSVAAMLESIYRAAGRRVGLYTSPHLISFRERLQVNRQMISERDVIRLVRELRTFSSPDTPPALDTSSDPPLRVPHSAFPAARSPLPSPTFFEFVTVMALKYFAEQSCDLVIWETGLGGRLDATNIVTPLASVITNIHYDHQRWLGQDLPSIAAEKAGIIKPGVPVITATAEPEALTVIEQTARALGSPLFHVTPAHTTRPPLDRIQLPLLGAHQRLNAATALATIHTLQSALPVSEPSIRQGLETVQWAGRLQLVDRPSPRSADISVCPTPPPPTPAAPDVRAPSGPPAQRLHILLDGAHNAAGAAVLRAAFKEQFEGIRSALILGMLDDKDWSAMCQILAPCADEVVCVPVKSERSADPRQLAQACRQAAPSVPVRILDSLACALEQTSGAPLTVVAGSLYLVGETLEWLDRDGSPPCAERALNEYTARSR